MQQSRQIANCSDIDYNIEASYNTKLNLSNANDKFGNVSTRNVESSSFRAFPVESCLNYQFEIALCDSL